MENDSKSTFKFIHVHIKCRDITATKEFYKQMFNAKILHEEEIRKAALAILEIGGCYVHLSETEPGEILESEKQERKTVWLRYGLGHFGFKVDDVDQAVRELKMKGARILGEPRDIREGVRVAYLRGPDDEVIEISQRSETFEALLRK